MIEAFVLKAPPGGLEPPTNGLTVRRSDAQSGCNEKTSAIASENLAEYLALLRRESAELALVVEAWPELPEAIQRAIVAMVDAAGEARVD